MKNETGNLSHKRVRLVEFKPKRRYTVAEMQAAFPPAPLTKPEAVKVGTNGAAAPRTWEERDAAYKRLIMASAKQNAKGIYEMRGVCHNGNGSTALCFDPATGASWCNANCDYDARLRGVGLTPGKLPRASDSTANKTAPAPWEPPATFYEHELPEFPVACLPPALRSFAEGLARETQTPVDLPALMALIVCAGACAGRVRVQARQGWIEPVNLYVVVVLPPGNRKSAVFSAACKPLEEIEREQTEAMREVIAKAASDLRILEQRRDKLEKDASREADAEKRRVKKEEANKVAAQVASTRVPVAPRLIASDATPEALASLLAEQSGRMSVLSPEGDLFDMLAGRYSNGAPNFDVILKGHCGDVLRVDRRTRSEYVEHPALTIGLTVQPDVIRGLVDKPGFRGRGLLGRFLYCIPKSKIGKRDIAPEPLSVSDRQTFTKLIRALASIEPSDPNGRPTARMLHLTADADVLLRKFEQELEPKLAEDAELGTMGDWAGKLSGAVLRIASILSLITKSENLSPFPDKIEPAAMESAIKIGDYLTAHARAAFAEMGADEQLENAKRLLRWIAKARLSEFTRRDAHQAHKARFKRVDEIDPALDLLVAHNYIRPRSDAAEGKRGRPASAVFDVNPHFIPTSHKSHKSQNSDERGISEDIEICETQSSENSTLRCHASESGEGEEWAPDYMAEDSDEAREMAAILEVDHNLTPDEAALHAREFGGLVDEIRRASTESEAKR